MAPENQSSCRSRCWSSRTLVPLSPFSSIAGAAVFVGVDSVVFFGAAVVGLAVGLGCSDASGLEDDAAGFDGTWLSGAGPACPAGIWPQPTTTSPRVRTP